ncbi:MAG: alpha/beta hydrolase [Gammaproteobacteria bacterium]|nr:MAG: alpha/beta hydrolase [Gammaproteobacteria bacterium]
MPYVNNEDVKIYYEVHGKGEPLVLIQGLGGTVRSWEPQLEFFAKHFQVILIDNRGAGQSDKPDTEYSIELFAKDVKCVLDYLEIYSINLLGISMGGFIAQRFYHLYPHLVKTLTLGCTGMGLNDPNHHMFSCELHEIMHAERNDENHSYLIEAMHKHFFHPVFVKRNGKYMKNLHSYTKAYPQPYHSYKRQLMACYSEKGLSEHLPDIKVPTLIIHGEDDQVVPVQNAHFLASNIPNSKLSIIPETGHMFFVEKSAMFNSEVFQFLYENKSLKPQTSTNSSNQTTNVAMQA